MDLPEINLEIYQTFEQASSTLDSLHAHGTKGRIEDVVGALEGTIKDLALLIKPMRNYDIQVLETIDLWYQNMENIPCVSKVPSPNQDLEHDAESRIPKLAAEIDDLVTVIKKSLALENSLLEETISSISNDVRSLRHTLSNAIFILKDLVSRSNSIKDPILKIMSGLQTHDIVNQDISIILHGLQVIRALREVSGNEDDILDAILFQEQASYLSQSLIAQIITVVRNHGRNLGQDIGCIEDTVSRIKEDKDAVGEFLLMNEKRKSTLDIVISEVSEIITNVFGKLEAIILLKKTQQAQTDRLISLCEDFDTHVTPETSVGLTREAFEAMSRMTFLFRSLAKMIKHVYGSLDLEERTEKFSVEAGCVTCNLEEIKALLIESIKGIDTYSSRCAEAIKRFRCDIEKITLIIDGNENVFDGLNTFARSMASIREEVFPHMSLNRREIHSQGFRDILSRLTNPHSNSLATGEDQEIDEGLVLF